MKSCKAIDAIIKMAEEEGNTILSISKSDLMDKVIWMTNRLSSLHLREKIESDFSELTYDRTKDKPHTPGCEFFSCSACKTVIVFPRMLDE
jgi:hypothetical protein